MNVQTEGVAAAVAAPQGTVHNAAAWPAPVNQVTEGVASYAQHWLEGLLSEDMPIVMAQERGSEPQPALDPAALDAAWTPGELPVLAWEHLPSMAVAAVHLPQRVVAAPAVASDTATQPVSAPAIEPEEEVVVRAVRNLSAAQQPLSAAAREPEQAPVVALDAVQAVTPRGLVTAAPTVPMSVPPTALEQAPLPLQKGTQPLVQALAQRIQVQQAQGADIATVRLDPPNMGSLEIRIRQEGAAVQVHLQASHSEVGRQLTTLVETLRHELQQRSSDVQVTVAQSRTASQQGGQGESQRQHQQQSPQEPVIGQALEANGQAWTDRA